MIAHPLLEYDCKYLIYIRLCCRRRAHLKTKYHDTTHVNFHKSDVPRTNRDYSATQSQLLASCFSPLSSLAAPTIEQAAVPPNVARELSSHEDCYATGEDFKALVQWNDINVTAVAGCDTFATSKGQVCGLGVQVKISRALFPFPDCFSSSQK